MGEITRDGARSRGQRALFLLGRSRGAPPGETWLYSSYFHEPVSPGVAGGHGAPAMSRATPPNLLLPPDPLPRPPRRPLRPTTTPRACQARSPPPSRRSSTRSSHPAPPLTRPAPRRARRRTRRPAGRSSRPPSGMHSARAWRSCTPTRTRRRPRCARRAGAGQHPDARADTIRRAPPRARPGPRRPAAPARGWLAARAARARGRRPGFGLRRPPRRRGS